MTSGPTSTRSSPGRFVQLARGQAPLLVPLVALPTTRQGRSGAPSGWPLGLLRTPPSRSEPPLPRLVRIAQEADLVGSQKPWSRGPDLHRQHMDEPVGARRRGHHSCPRTVSSFFHHVPIADEAWFHTVLRNSTGLTFAPGDARYIHWTEGEAAP